MKINELARISGVSPETIRKYRERGLLNPQCNAETAIMNTEARTF